MTVAEKPHASTSGASGHGSDRIVTHRVGRVGVTSHSASTSAIPPLLQRYVLLQTTTKGRTEAARS